MKKLSEPRRALLACIAEAGGILSNEQLTASDQRLADRMETDGLVRWVLSTSREYHLIATPAGRAAIQEATHDPR